MKTIPSLVERYCGPWTDDAFEDIPEGVRFEVQDGELVITGSLPLHHQRIAFRLTDALQATCPADLIALPRCEIRVEKAGRIVHSRVPDVMVLPSELARLDSERCWVRPEEVPLVGEVVSENTRITDRITKVGIYAGWGIPLYLRLERKPMALYEYRLDPITATYRTPVEHTEVFETNDPYPIRVELAALMHGDAR